MSERLKNPSLLTSADMRGATGSPAQALVAIVIGGAPLADPPPWKAASPQAALVRIDMRQAPHPNDTDWLARKLSDLVARRRMRPGQLVLLGRNGTGRFALDRVLDGTLPCAGIVGVDMSCAPPRTGITATTASVRLVLHAGEVERTGGDSLISALRRADIDTRIMTLPSTEPDMADAAARATDSFLFELIAKACSHAPH